MQAQQRDIFADVAAFANRFSDPLLNALTGIVVGAVTAAVTGNLVDGVKIAAAGVGKLIIEIVKTPPATKSLGSRTKSLAQRTFAITMTIPLLIAFLCALAFIALVVKLFGAKADGYEEFQTEVATALQNQEKPVQPTEDDDEDFRSVTPLKRKAVITAINRWADGSTLAGCDRDGANMTRFVLERWGVPEEKIASALKRYWASENGCIIRVLHDDLEVRIIRNNKATCENLIYALKWLRVGMREGDKRLYYHSGHGTQTPSKTEGDLLNECIVAFDHNWNENATWFIDDNTYNTLKDLLVPSDFPIMLDTCHSEGFLRDAGVQVRFLTPPPHLVEGRTLKPRAVENDSYLNDNVLLLSGCTSDSVSYSNNYTVNGEFVSEGAFTHEFLKEHAKTPLAPIEEIYKRYYATLSNGKYVQRPQLQGSKRLMATPFLVGA